MSEAKKNERGYALKGGKWVQIEGGKKFERTEYDELNNEYIEYGRNRIQNEGERWQPRFQAILLEMRMKLLMFK